MKRSITDHIYINISIQIWRGKDRGTSNEEEGTKKQGVGQ